MLTPNPTTRFLLLNEARTRAAQTQSLDSLRQQLSSFPDFAQVQLAPNGESTVVASVPAKNQRQTDRLKALVNEKVDGWRVIEDQSFQLPETF